MKSSDSSVEEIGRFDADRTSMVSDVVTCRIENRTSFTARVVLMAHQHHDLWEHRALVPAGQTISIPCLTGQVVVVVFDSDSDAFYQGRVLRVGNSFTFLIS